MKQYKKILTLAILFIIKYSIVSCIGVIMLKFIENHHLSPSISFNFGMFYVSFAVLFFKIFDSICDEKNIILTIKKNKLPIKSRFSMKDYKDWKLTKVDFYPFDFDMKDDFAIKIAKVCFKLSPDDEESRETLEQAIHYSRSTIILNGDVGLQRVFFETEKDLENFLIHYTKEE
jgi:hypothetical protein